MQDRRNHSFTSNFKIREFSLRIFLFLLPVIIIYFIIEFTLATMDLHEAIKNDFIEANAENIEILFLGSSQIERAINPKFLSKTTINLGNSSQIFFEDFELLKHFRPKLENLKVVVLEVSYDKLERDKSHVLPIIDHKNLKFYGVNTFGRSLKPQDYFLFHSNPDYFSHKLEMHFLNNSPINLNQYGFDENKFDGAYSHANYVLIENVENKENYDENLETLHNIIQYCQAENLKILIYHPPTHYRYNKLRDPILVRKWKKLLADLDNNYEDLYFFIDDENKKFSRKYFDDANHLNPNGAEKATKIVDSVILKDLY